MQSYAVDLRSRQVELVSSSSIVCPVTNFIGKLSLFQILKTLDFLSDLCLVPLLRFHLQLDVIGRR